MSSFFNSLVIIAAVLLVTGVSERSGLCSKLNANASPTLSCALVQSLADIVAAERPDVDEAKPASAVEVPAAQAATNRQQVAAPAASPIETTNRAEPGPEARAPAVATATQDAQRRAFRSADGLAEAAALADTLAARLTEERRALALARQAVADANDEAAASAEAAKAAKAAARRAAAEAESSRMASRAEETLLSQARQRNVRLQRETADEVARASAHEEALRALRRQADQRAMAVAEAQRRNAERDAAAAAAEEAAKVHQARLEAAETREADLRRAADAVEMRTALRRAELDAAERAAAAMDRAIVAAEERVAQLEVRSAAAAASLAREGARWSEVSAASEGPSTPDGSGAAGAPTSLLAYAETVSPLLPTDGTIANDAGGDGSERARLAAPLPAEPSPMADERGDAGATEPDVDRVSALPPADPVREDTLALASHGDTDVTPLSDAAPVFSAEGIGSVSISAPHATLRFSMAEGVEAELAFGGPDDFDRVAAAVADADALHYSRTFENAFVTSGVDDAVDDPGYYTLGLRSSGRSVIIRLRFAATPAEGAPQAVRDVVNAVACSALFGSASLPCREEQIRTTASQQ